MINEALLKAVHKHQSAEGWDEEIILDLFAEFVTLNGLEREFVKFLDDVVEENGKLEELANHGEFDSSELEDLSEDSHDHPWNELAWTDEN